MTSKSDDERVARAHQLAARAQTLRERARQLRRAAELVEQRAQDIYVRAEEMRASGQQRGAAVARESGEREPRAASSGASKEERRPHGQIQRRRA